MGKKIAILGSTGSIGCQTLKVVEQFSTELKVVGLAARSNLEMIEEQARRFRPEAVALSDPGAAKKLKKNLRDLQIKVYSGDEGLLEIAALNSAEMVVVALVGFSGLKPTLAALKAGKEVALANKEALVVGGEIITAVAEKKRLPIYPVDSEHSAIFQCLQGVKINEVQRLILTASGGPFLGFGQEKLQTVSPEEALKHPNWEMGTKITIDSATLMNKGFEVLEAKWLFAFDLDQIEVIIHPQSVIHSLVECIDGAVLAQLGIPYMSLPIQYALFYPERRVTSRPSLNLLDYPALTFLNPDRQNFPCLELAYRAGKMGGTAPACLNAANEVAVELFLGRKLSFWQIPQIISQVLDKHAVKANPDLKDLVNADCWARSEALKLSAKEEGAD